MALERPGDGDETSPMATDGAPAGGAASLPAAAPLPPPPAASSHAATDGLRGLLALLVTLGHIIVFWVGDPAKGTWPYVGLEFLSPVTMFFVLSGHSLVATYAGTLPPAGATAASIFPTPAALRGYARKRVARIAPLYYVGLLLALPAALHYGWENDPLVPPGAPPLELLLGLPAAAAGVQSATVLVGNRINSPAWQVSALALCYAAFPRVAGALRPLRPAALVRVLAACQAASVALGAVQLLALPTQTLLVAHMFAGFRAVHFLAGCAAGLLSARSPLARPALVADACAAVLLANAALCAARAEAARPAFAPYFAYGVGAEYALVGVHAALVMALCDPAGGARRSWAAWALSARPLRWLGRLSYSLSCTHWGALALCAWAAAGGSFARVPTTHEGDVKLTVWRWFAPAATPWLLAACVGVAWAAQAALEPIAARAALRVFDALWPPPPQDASPPRPG